MKVSVVTVTMRGGWWNVMAHSLAQQTLKDFEWIIIDDYPEDRTTLAQKYAKQYGLNIKYVRSKDRTHQRSFGLVNANNTAIQHMGGDLSIWLQDFVVIPPDALQKAWTLYSKFPDNLFAYVDSYNYPSVEPDIANQEDWFGGKVDVVGKLIRTTHRLDPKGMVQVSDDPYMFEMNYAGIPKKILRQLNGWWEFMDDGFGFDNTEIAFRAIKFGYKIFVDSKNPCVCLEHREYLDHLGGDVKDRKRNYNDPRFQFLADLVDLGVLPVVRREEIDSKLRLLYEIPRSIDEDHAIAYMRFITPFLVGYWIKKNFPEFYKQNHGSQGG